MYTKYNYTPIEQETDIFIEYCNEVIEDKLPMKLKLNILENLVRNVDDRVIQSLGGNL